MEILPPGRHVRWGAGWAVERIEALPKIRMIGCQEVLTSEGAPVRVDGCFCARVTDPHRYRMSSVNPDLQLTTEAQVAIRDWAAPLDFEAALKDREALQKAVDARLQGVTPEFGMQMEWVIIRDLAPGPGLRGAYLDVLKAQLEAKSSLERARAEAATMRSLANTAKLLKEHPGLLELRLLQGNRQPRVTFLVGETKGVSVDS